MIRISSEDAPALANVLHQRCLDDVVGIQDLGDALWITFPGFDEERVVMDDLDYEHVQYTHV